jgi:hypothetical protein
MQHSIRKPLANSNLRTPINPFKNKGNGISTFRNDRPFESRQPFGQRCAFGDNWSFGNNRQPEENRPFGSRSCFDDNRSFGNNRSQTFYSARKSNLYEDKGHGANSRVSDVSMRSATPIKGRASNYYGYGQIDNSFNPYKVENTHKNENFNPFKSEVYEKPTPFAPSNFG